MSTPVITYSDILAPNYGVSGIRQDAGDGHPVVITGGYQPGPGTKLQGMLYRGVLSPTDSTGYIRLVPQFPGQTVTTSNFYGPNTSLFNPEMGAGNIRVVGSYKYRGGPKGDQGLMYQGALDGSGTWTQIVVPDAVAGGPVANTLCHSTMGDLVVGNYDLAGQPASGNGFIYNVQTRTYTLLEVGNLATAYGIWQNGGSGSTAYTVTGGYVAEGDVNTGFLLNYDSATGVVTDVTSLSFNGEPGIVTHFEGITGVPGGLSVVGMYLAGRGSSEHFGVFIAGVPRSKDGSFGPATWLEIHNPDSGRMITGNSILENSLIGLYPVKGGLQSYVATLSI